MPGVDVARIVQAQRTATMRHLRDLTRLKSRTDDAYFAPLKGLKLGAGTELYLGLIHHNDAEGDKARLAAARRHTHVDGIGTECGMGRGAPERLPGLLAAHAKVLEA